MKTTSARRKVLSRPHSMYSLRCYDDAMAQIDAMSTLRSVPRSQIIRDAIDFFLAHNRDFASRLEVESPRMGVTVEAA